LIADEEFGKAKGSFIVQVLLKNLNLLSGK
jgi:hypothetical protein